MAFESRIKSVVIYSPLDFKCDGLVVVVVAVVVVVVVVEVRI